MKFKTKQRILSVVMALLMTISLLPTDFVGGNVVVSARDAQDFKSSSYDPAGTDLVGTYSTTTVDSVTTVKWDFTTGINTASNSSSFVEGDTVNGIKILAVAGSSNVNTAAYLKLGKATTTAYTTIAIPTSGLTVTSLKITSTQTSSNYIFKNGETTYNAKDSAVVEFTGENLTVGEDGYITVEYLGTSDSRIASIEVIGTSGSTPTPTTYAITVTNDGNGTASADVEEAAEGATVTLTATANDGYQFKEWQVVSGEVTITDNKFEMPASAVEVKAIFEEKAADPVDDKTIASGTYDFIGTFKTVEAANAIDGMAVDGFSSDSHGHGLESAAGATVTLNLKEAANVIVTECMYGSAEVTASSGTVENTVTCVPSNVDGVYTIKNAEAGELVITFAAGTNYLHAIQVEYLSEIKTVAAGTYDFISAYATVDDINAIDGLSTSGMTKHASHGVTTSSGTITLDLASAAKITIEECKYGSIVPTAGDLTVDTIAEYVNGNDGTDGVYKITAPEGGRVVINIAGSISAYIHSVAVEYITAEERTITVTAEGNGKAIASKSKAYVDDVVTITATPNTGATFKGWTVVSPATLVLTDASSAETTFTMPDENVEIKAVFEGGLTEAEVELTQSNDFDFTGTFTTLNSVGSTSVLTSGQTVMLGKLNSSGISYDATGFAKFRTGNVLYLPLVNADTTKVVVKMICSQEDGTRCITVGSDENGTYKVKVSKSLKEVTVPDIDDFVVTVGDVRYLPVIATGEVKTYHIYVDEYNPVNSVVVSGTVSNAAANGVTQIKFKNVTDTTRADVVAEIDSEGKYSATLKRVDGNTSYVAAIPNIGYKLDDTDGANKFTLTGNATTFPKDFAVVESPVAQISGTLTGVPDSALKGDLKVTLVPENNSLDSVEVTLTKNGETYTYEEVYLAAGEKYSVVLTNADDYEVLNKVCELEGMTPDVDIVATAKPVVSVSGKFVTSDKKTSDVTKITFTNIETPDYKYTFDVTGDTYSAELRAAEYVTSVESTAYSAYDHVSVGDAAVTNDVYLQAPEDSSSVEYKAEINVGAGQEFETIAEAVKYVSRMTRTNGERVTLLLTDEVYREQLVINTPNITIKSANASGVSAITWYYGVGYSYYSAKLSADGKSIYYDEALAIDKYQVSIPVTQNPGHWGATVNLLAGAEGFQAENIIFENSFNRYMTADEVEDGVGTGTGECKLDRSVATDADVIKRAYKERAAAIYIQADKTEYKNCEFLSSQDTVYTGDSNEHSYFVDCKIEGTTDYICGDGNPVFDRCLLSMYSYSDQEATGSFIVANKAKATDGGYFFNDCSIATTDYPGLKATSGNLLARAWDAGSIKWYNTLVESSTMLATKAYADMNASVSNANYQEYNTHLADGTIVTTNQGITSGVTIHVEDPKFDMTANFGGWEPDFYTVASYSVALDKSGLKNADAALDIAADDKVSTDDVVVVTITPTEGYVFSVAPTVSATGATAGTPAKQTDGSYKCEITTFTSEATVTVSGEAVLDTEPTFTVDLVQTELTGATATMTEVTKVHADDVVTVTITPADHKLFEAAPTVTADNATAGEVTKQADGSYKCDVTTFTANTVITVVGATVDEPSYDFSINKEGLTGATAEPDTEETTKVYNDDVVTITLTPDSGTVFDGVPSVTADNATVGEAKALTGGAYSFEVTGFTATTVITVTGATKTAPSIESYVLLGDTENVFAALTAETAAKSADGYFSLGIKVKGTKNEKEYPDGNKFTYRLQTGTKMVVSKSTGYVKFTTTKPAIVIVHANQSGGSTGDVRKVTLVDSAGATVAVGPDLVKGTVPEPFVFVLESAGTYYLGELEVGGIDIYRVEVKEGTTTVPTTYKAELVSEGLTNAKAKLSKSVWIPADGEVTVTVTPDEGASFKAAPVVTATVGTAGEVTDNGDGTYKCVISGITADTQITVTGGAEYPEFDVTVDSTGLTNAKAEADKTKATVKDTVTVTITPDTGMEFKTAPTVTLKKVDTEEDTATVGTVTKAAEGDAYTCEVTAFNAATEIVVAGTATAKPVIVKITVENDGNGTAAADKTEVEEGTTVNLTATANDGYTFKEWVVTGEGASVADKSAATTTLTVGSVDVTVKATFEKNKVPADLTKIKAFVERLYKNILGRDADEEGINTWVTALANGTLNGATASYGFVNSDEFKNSGLTNEQKVEIFYATFLNRVADAEGKKMWADALNAGVDIEKIFEGFVMSTEFAGICDTYGISQGQMSDIPGMTDILNRYRNRNIFLASFVARCYEKALGRPADVPGVDVWCAQIIEGYMSPRNVAANGFFHSDEFIAKNTTNAQYVAILYETFLGRELDQPGYELWVGLLDRNEWTRDQVLDGFADSDEFAVILASFGLN
ncbi:MAG: pectinesterase family protein [Lachnospiraceae bacterium]